MSSSFQSTAFRSAASPVDTFVAPPRVQPKTGAEELATVLSSINPKLQQFISFQLDQEKQKQEQLGMEKVIQASKPELQKIISQVKKQDGSKAARQLIGSNIFFRAGVEKQLAKTLGSFTETKAKTFFDNYTIQKQLNDGTVVDIPLEQYDIDSPEFQSALEEFNQSSKSDTKGIRQLYISEFFLPQQSKALQKIHINHQKNHNEYKVQNAEQGIQYSLKLGFLNIDDNQEKIDEGLIDNPNNLSGIDISRNAVQETLQDFVDNGLTEAVSPSSMIEIVKDTANSIFLENEDNNLDGYDAVNDFLKFAGELQVGPRQIKKDGTLKETKLKDFYQEDIRKLRVELLNASEKFRDEEERDAIENRQKIFLDEIKQYGFFQVEDGKVNRDRLNNLAELYSEELDFLKDKIEIEDFSRDDWFRNFENDLRFKGVYDTNPSGAYTELIKFEKSLGVTITDEDKRNLERLKNEIEETLGKGLRTNRSTEILNNLKTAKDMIGEKDITGTISLNKEETANFYDLEKRYVDKIREIESDLTKTTEERNELIKEETIKLFVDAKKIKAKQYDPTGIMAEVDRRFKEFDKQKDNNNPFLNPTNNLFNQDNQDKKTGAELFFGGRKNNVEGGAFSEGGFTTVDIVSGDTLSGIANDLDTSVEAIMKANNMTNTNIQIGDVLVIPEGITDPNKVDAPNFDMNKLITSSDHPFNPVREKHNFQVIYNIAKDIGIKYPELVAAQAMEETGYGKDQSADNNFLGLKATSSEVARGQSERKMTTEDRGQGRKPEVANFKTFNNIREMMMQYKKEWNDNFLGRKGIANADSIEEAIKMLQAEDYATNKDYDKNVLSIISRATREGWF